MYFYDTETMVLDYVITAAFTFLCVGFIGNSITVGFIGVSKQLHTPTYVTIGCLAVADVFASVTRYVQILSESFDFFLKITLKVYIRYLLLYVFIRHFSIWLYLRMYVLCSLQIPCKV